MLGESDGGVVAGREEERVEAVVAERPPEKRYLEVCAVNDRIRDLVRYRRAEPEDLPQEEAPEQSRDEPLTKTL